MLRNLSKHYLFICCKQSSSTHFCHFLATAFATDVLAGSNPMRRAQKRKASNTGGLTIQWWAMRDVRVRLAPPASRFVAPLLACCAGKRFAFPQLRTLSGSNPSAMGPKKKGSHCWEPNNSVVGDEGCPRAAGAARVPLRRSAPRVLRWKTLRVSSAPHPVGFESLCDGPKKERLPLLGA